MPIRLLCLLMTLVWPATHALAAPPPAQAKQKAPAAQKNKRSQAAQGARANKKRPAQKARHSGKKLKQPPLLEAAQTLHKASKVIGRLKTFAPKPGKRATRLNPRRIATMLKLHARSCEQLHEQTGPLSAEDKRKRQERQKSLFRRLKWIRSVLHRQRNVSAELGEQISEVANLVIRQ